MDLLRLKPRQPVEDAVENWDDDDFMLEGEDMTFGSSSTAAKSAPLRRDSYSSFRSDFESVHAEEEKQVHVPGDDEKSTLDAIAVAARAGIPIPKDVPPSALMGGTIKRLGGKKIKQIFQDDWGDDLEFPDSGNALHIKPQDSAKFPDVLRQVSGGSTQHSPVKVVKQSPTVGQEGLNTKPTLSAPAINLDRFRDNDDEDDFFGDGGATIKVSKTRQAPKPISLITPPTPQKKGGEDDFEQDLELPSDGKLRLSKRKEIPKTPSMNTLDDFDWGEGSLGTRFGGTRRDGRSNRSSSVSALSPSVSSSLTMESEDETFDGLVLPTGPVNFGERLKRRRQSRSPQRPSEGPPRSSPSKLPQSTQQLAADKDDFMSGLEIGDVEVFDSGKLTLHRNVKVKETRPASPSRPKTAVSLTFTSKPISRLPRPMASHERTHTASSLEPVSESGGPITSLARRSQSRLGHSAQSSVSSILTPTTPSSAHSLPPSTPRRREIGQKTSNISLRNEPTTTNAQLLRLKRSLPVMRPPPSPARPGTSRGYDRPPSRTDSSHSSRPQSALRPKTPVDRGRAVFESAAAQARKNPLPFLPAGASQSQSQHVTTKSSRVFRRHDSDTIIDLRPTSRAVSRSTMRSPSPQKRYRQNVDRIAHEGSWQQLSRPRKGKHFGDGHELDGFDDLPTSSQAEARYIRPPTNGRARPHPHNKVYQNVLPDRNNTPSPLGLYASRVESVPHFARETTASRIAREAGLAQRAPSGPLAQLTTQRVAQLSTRINYTVPLPPNQAVRSKKSRKLPQQLKPYLISNLGSAKESKSTSRKVHFNVPDTPALVLPPRSQRGGPCSRLPQPSRPPAGMGMRASPNAGSPSTKAGTSSPSKLPRWSVQRMSTPPGRLETESAESLSSSSPTSPSRIVRISSGTLIRCLPDTAVNGMFYNPVSMRWEGNENAVSGFDAPASSPSTASLPPYMLREKENATPRPALITPIGATKGVQVVGGMVFDPQNMCWLKLEPQTGKSEAGDTMDGFNGIDSDDDVFKDIPDLDDAADTTEPGVGRVSDVKDEWLVGEEFDVGPEFVRRQREEEQRWRKKCEKWLNFEDRNHNAWRWALRDLIVNPSR